MPHKYFSISKCYRKTHIIITSTEPTRICIWFTLFKIACGVSRYIRCIYRLHTRCKLHSLRTLYRFVVQQLTVQYSLPPLVARHSKNYSEHMNDTNKGSLWTGCFAERRIYISGVCKMTRCSAKLETVRPFLNTLCSVQW